MNLQLKRIYETPAKSDGKRILVDRLWPRGLKKEDVSIDLWLKEIAPSSELRKWFGHDPEKWSELKKRYARELDDHPEQVEALKEELENGKVTFLYSAKDQEHNNAVALKEYLEKGN